VSSVQPAVTVTPLDALGLDWAQALVVEGHYLHAQVDQRCSPLAYRIEVHARTGVGRLTAGCLIFGRPQATRCRSFYGTLDDVNSGWCEVSRWCVLNLARVYVDPAFQPAGLWYGPDYVPGFIDRHGCFRSELVSKAIVAALDSVVFDYLRARPPCFLEQPYQLAYVMSYCNTHLHRGVVYRASGFELFRTNARGIQTWRKRARPLTDAEDAKVQEASWLSPRSQEYRRDRASKESVQLTLWEAA
jgi:hypothetical protein